MKKRRLNFFDRPFPGNTALFLDRDGVINERLPGDYVKSWEDFTFLPGVPAAIATLSSFFSLMFIVTNQQGIGKGIMDEGALQAIHQRMLEAINAAGGRIDHIYHCPDLENSGSLYRKPSIGMALRARKDFPGLRLRESVMAGDSISDMFFGRNAGMVTVFISKDGAAISHHHDLIDYAFPDLATFAGFIKQKRA